MFMGLKQWNEAMQDAQKGLELAQRDEDAETIKLLEEKIAIIEETFKTQNNNINNE